MDGERRHAPRLERARHVGGDGRVDRRKLPHEVSFEDGQRRAVAVDDSVAAGGTYCPVFGVLMRFDGGGSGGSPGFPVSVRGPLATPAPRWVFAPTATGGACSEQSSVTSKSWGMLDFFGPATFVTKSL